MTRAKPKDQKPRTITLSAPQAVLLERAQAHRTHLATIYSQPLQEIRDAEDAIQTALNEILSAAKVDPSESGWHLSIEDDEVKLVEGPPE